MLARFSIAAAMAAALFTAAPAMAQDPDSQPTMSVNPDPLQSGGNATITYSDPEKSGQTITVDIDNGQARNLQTAQVTIVLDANGDGTAVWEVPNWLMAKFNAPGVAEIGLPVL